MVEKAEAVEVTGSQLGDLADAAGHGVLVAFSAGLRVVDGTESVVEGLALLEGLSVQVELRLAHQAIGQIVESRRGLGGTALRERHCYHERSPQ
jgi:hypothetical protein